MYLRARITTSCRTVDTRYTRLNLLGWALLCPYARDLLWHGSMPLSDYGYPTGDEANKQHESLKSSVIGELEKVFIGLEGIDLVNIEQEYNHELSIRRGDGWICARSKADILATIAVSGELYTVYVEVTTRLHVAKPWQALLRGLAFYYERRLPVIVILVSPDEVRYKPLTEHDQERVLVALNRSSNGFQPSPNLCSLCELVHYCPYRVI